MTSWELTETSDNSYTRPVPESKPLSRWTPSRVNDRDKEFRSFRAHLWTAPQDTPPRASQDQHPLAERQTIVRLTHAQLKQRLASECKVPPPRDTPIETLCHALDARAIQLQALANDFEEWEGVWEDRRFRVASFHKASFHVVHPTLNVQFLLPRLLGVTSLVDENGRLWSNIANRAKLQHKPTRKDAIACIVFVRPNHILMSSTSTLLWRLETLDGFDRVLW